MKEAERLLQWCPHRRTPITVDQNAGPPVNLITVAGNSAPATAPPPPVLLEVGTCIGHACSQWRWEDDGLVRVAPPRLLPVTWGRDSDDTLVREEPLPRPPDAANPLFVWFARLELWIRPYGAGDRPGHCGLSGDAPNG